MMSHLLSLRAALTLIAIALLSPAIVHTQSVDRKLAPQPSGTITGQVSLRGKPVAGVPLAAIAGGTVNRRDAVARAVTDGQGYYRFTGLPPGEYQIWTMTPGLIAESQLNAGYLPYGSSKSILLSANENVANVDLTLISGGVITGRVTSGNNKPVPEERVTLELLDENGNPRYGILQSTRDEMYRTDDRGIYRIYGLPPGRYRISVGYNANESIRGSLYPTTYYSEPDDASKAAIVELKEGSEVADINIKLGEREASFAVAGRIVDATTGQPLAGVRYRIAVVEKEPNRTPSFGGLPTESNGEFRFEGLRPGRYNIAVFSAYSAGGNFYSDPVNFEVVDQDVTGLEIKAKSGLMLSGTVVSEGLTIAQMLAILPDLRVGAWPETRVSGQSTGGATAVVAADGSFQIMGLRPGRLRVDVFANIRSGARPTVARIEREGVDIGRSFELQQSQSGIVIVVSAGTGSIRGTITFAGGALPAEARIFVGVRPEGSGDLTTVQTDARGNFLIKNLAPGTYDVELQLSWSRRGPPYPRPPQKQIVNVTNGSQAEVNFLIELIQPPVRP